LVRWLLRIAGRSLVLLGFASMAVGAIDVLAAVDNGSLPRYFWCCLTGVPLWLIGLAVFHLGQAPASANAPSTRGDTPVTSEGSSDSFQSSAGTGNGSLAAVATDEAADRCLEQTQAAASNPRYRYDDEQCAKLFEDRGRPVSATKDCAACHEPNDMNARFCDQCGQPFIEVAVESHGNVERRRL